MRRLDSSFDENDGLPQVLCDEFLYHGNVDSFVVFVLSVRVVGEWGKDDFVQYFGSFLKDWKGISSRILRVHSPREVYGPPFLTGMKTSVFLCLLLELFVRNDSRRIK